MMFPTIISFKSLWNNGLYRNSNFLQSEVPIRLFSRLTKAIYNDPVTSISLQDLRDNPGAMKPRTRWGRGVGSGRGKTCGRGHKGQKSRSGKRHPPLGFEGGQFPFYRRAPKKGFKNINHIEFEPLNLGKLQAFIDKGKIPTDRVINMRILQDSGVVGRIHQGVKVLADGADRFHASIALEVTAASKSALDRLKETGSTISFLKLSTNQLQQFLRRPEPNFTSPNNSPSTST
jgi:large subunit ribosomal protein L15